MGAAQVLHGAGVRDARRREPPAVDRARPAGAGRGHGARGRSEPRRRPLHAVLRVRWAHSGAANVATAAAAVVAAAAAACCILPPPPPPPLLLAASSNPAADRFTQSSASDGPI